MRVVMDERAEDLVAVASVFGSVEDVLVPEIVERARPRHHRFPRMGDDQIEELAIFTFDAAGVPAAKSPEPPLFELELPPHRLQIERRHLRPLLVHCWPPRGDWLVLCKHCGGSGTARRL